MLLEQVQWLPNFSALDWLHWATPRCETEGHRVLSKHSRLNKSFLKSTICFKSVISGWNSFPQCCPLVFWLGARPRNPRGRQGERLGLLTTFSSLFLYFPDRFSNIRGGVQGYGQVQWLPISSEQQLTSCKHKKSAAPVIDWKCHIKLLT